MRLERPKPTAESRSARVCARALLSALVLLATDTALAARLVDVRIGTHPGYARVVLETDAPAVHEIVTAPAATPGEVVVRIAATSIARTLPGRGEATPEVALEPQPDGTTLARIRAAGPIRVETQVLRAPPRVVLDLRAGEVVPAPVAPVETASETAPEIVPPLAPETNAEEPPAPEAAPPPPDDPAATPPEPVAAPAPVPAEQPGPANEAPAPPEPSAETALPPPPPVVVVPLPRGVVVEPRTPPVEAPPPAAIAWEPRSLAVGAALGVGLVLLALATRRTRNAVPAAIDAIDATGPPEADTTAASEAEIDAALAESEASPAAEEVTARAPEPDPELAEDWVRIHRRLDARLADIAARLDAVAARQADLDRREGAQTHEIAAQRAAIARLQRALRPAPRLRRNEKDAG